jgi:hypothetical protein
MNKEQKAKMMLSDTTPIWKGLTVDQSFKGKLDALVKECMNNKKTLMLKKEKDNFRRIQAVRKCEGISSRIENRERFIIY